ncbi:hypothetical protein LTR29_007599 [Friedmanniomyces endolithicus]|nr:hypothetical protein LTR29_007599 [Friedmanniomyces endolithicus]
MFHSGDLNSGISLAIKERKLVACLVREDDDPVSTTWEEEWLGDLEEVVTEKTVLLRMDYGGKEAGFLSVFCTIDKAPTLVVIHNGHVLEKLESGIEREEFVDRLLAALGLGEDEQQQEPVAPMKLGDSTATPDVAQAASAIASAVVPQAATSSSQPRPSPTNPSSLFPDRAARLEADKQTRDAAEKATRQSRSEARRKEAEDAYANHRGDKGKGKQSATEEDAGKRKARDSYLAQQKKRNDDAKQDRARILAQIETDKANRRARSERVRPEGDGATESAMPESRLSGMRRSAGASGTCSLQIRLFDGSSIRGRFPGSTTVAGGVRQWVRVEAPAGSGGADIPYTFRQILAPAPSRSIEVSEEHETLQSLGLAPSATLVLVPVAGSVNAYAGPSSGWLGWGSGLLSSAYSSMPDVGYYLPSFSRLYMGGTGDPQEAGNVEGAAMAGADSLPNAADAGASTGRPKTRTLADQRAEAMERKDKRTEFYNGNSLGFESRKDGKDEEGKEELARVPRPSIETPPHKRDPVLLSMAAPSRSFARLARPPPTRPRTRPPYADFWRQSRAFQTKVHSSGIPDYAFAFDIDGVLLRSSNPLPGAHEALTYLQRQRIPFILLTNGGGKSETERVAELSEKLNVELNVDMFVQSHTPFAEMHEYKDKTVLVVGGDYDKCQLVAKDHYGFQNVVTPGDIVSAHPDIWPFSKVFMDYYKSFAKPLPKPINPSTPSETLKIDAIFVYNDPRDWGLDSTIILDLLLSSRGRLGTLSPQNGSPTLPNRGYQQDAQPPLYYSNPDLWWAASHPLPRLGQGGFRVAFAGLWDAVTGGAKLEYTMFGKPHQLTYEFAERRLRAHRKMLFGQRGLNDPLRRVYMVGDNPESDIRGANEYKSPHGSLWRSLLVKTGVYREGTVPSCEPTVILKDVGEGVRWAVEDSGKS